ncbi:MAG: hypothetical protein NWE80_01900, partial [Candidatus Bathyarchaeota archaeon]|nr:hypothetical protein [Candidatus Bathyarchaeota archaeon]
VKQIKAKQLEAGKQQQVISKTPWQIEIFQTEQQSASPGEANESSGCKYYFGYLCEREKGKQIPSECLECPKSLDCMLNNYKSKESVVEIKKWYPATN